MLLGAALLGPTAARAQTGNLTITDAPAPIAFAPWREMLANEFTVQYEESFPSAYVSPSATNNQVKLRVFLPPDRTGPTPVVLALHYWGASNLTLETAMAESLASEGISLVAMTLPYHLSRTPAGARTGQLAVQGDPESLIALVTQSVLDIRRTVDWIETRPEFRKGSLGLVGTSLGALLGAAAFGVEPRFGSAVFLLGGADYAHLVWNSSLVAPQREALRRKGFSEDSLHERLKGIDPVTYLRPDGRPTFVVAGRHDTVVPRGSTERLIQALGSPQTLWLNTGHYGGVLVRRQLVRTVTGFFHSTLSGGQFLAPDGFYSPTIRMGLHANTQWGMQVAAGIDVWRSNAKGDAYASALLTPRGGVGFVGVRVAGDLSLGVSVMQKKTTVGLVWSVVL